MIVDEDAGTTSLDTLEVTDVLVLSGEISLTEKVFIIGTSTLLMGTVVVAGALYLLGRGLLFAERDCTHWYAFFVPVYRGTILPLLLHVWIVTRLLRGTIATVVGRNILQ